MGWFRKQKKEEIVDLVALKKRGLIQDKDIGIEEQIVDLSKKGENPLGFLGSFAAASDSPDNNSSVNVVKADEEFDDRKRRVFGKLVKIENRVDSLSTQMQKIADRLDVLERKLERKS